MTRRRTLWALLALYGAAVVAIVSWPIPVDTGAHASLLAFIGSLHRAGLTFVSYAGIEFSANVVMFAPLGFLLAALAGPGRRVLMFAVCVAATLTIELGQWLFLPHRFASAGDLLANSLGAAVGVTTAALTASAPRRRSAPR